VNTDRSQRTFFGERFDFDFQIGVELAIGKRVAKLLDRCPPTSR